MKTKLAISILIALLAGGGVVAEDRGQSGPDGGGHKGPPPQAYEDCKGKKAGDKVQHTTPDGKVSATCEDTPQGLVARPDNRPSGKGGDRPPHEKGGKQEK